MMSVLPLGEPLVDRVEYSVEVGRFPLIPHQDPLDGLGEDDAGLSLRRYGNYSPMFLASNDFSLIFQRLFVKHSQRSSAHIPGVQSTLQQPEKTALWRWMMRRSSGPLSA